MFQLKTSTRISAAAPHRGSCACRSSHYDALGVSPDSSDDDIKSAYRQHAKRWHPDINKAVSPVSMHACTQSMYPRGYPGIEFCSPKQTPIQDLTCVLPGPTTQPGWGRGPLHPHQHCIPDALRRPAEGPVRHGAAQGAFSGYCMEETPSAGVKDSSLRECGGRSSERVNGIEGRPLSLCPSAFLPPPWFTFWLTHRRLNQRDRCQLAGAGDKEEAEAADGSSTHGWWTRTMLNKRRRRTRVRLPDH